MAQNSPSDRNELASGPPSPPPVYQDKPPTYDEAISGKAPDPDAVGFNFPTQPESHDKREYYPPAPEYGPGPPPGYSSPTTYYPQGPQVPQPEGNHRCPPGMMPSTLYNVEFRKHPISVTCPNCSSFQETRVEDKINSEGWLWCILCCCCGFWLLSFLVKCMDGFREFHHYCPRCGKKLASYCPKFTPASIVLLIILALLTVILIGFACYFRMNLAHGRYDGGRYDSGRYGE